MGFYRQRQVSLFSVQRIWDRAPHNAFTDLIRFKGKWIIAFREGERHVGGSPGEIQLLTSEDGINWLPTFHLKEEGIDLRDPKLSITPKGELMLLYAGVTFNKTGLYLFRQSRVVFSTDGKEFTAPLKVLDPHDWLWKVTWHQGKAYGVSYTPKHKLTLCESYDGKIFSPTSVLDIEEHPSECALRFLPTGEMIALVRREFHALLGMSVSPFEEWKWRVLSDYLAGFDLLVLPDNYLLAAGRTVHNSPYASFQRTTLFLGSFDRFFPILVLPSGKDTGYPGMVYSEGILWMSYYSSHEGKAAIYLAQILI